MVEFILKFAFVNSLQLNKHIYLQQPPFVTSSAILIILEQSCKYVIIITLTVTAMLPESCGVV